MKGWYEHSNEHALAAKGISTKHNMGNANRTAVKHRVSDSIQNNMHALDKHIRQSTKTDDMSKIQQHLKEADKMYEHLEIRIRSFKQQYGELPWWVSQIWHGKEDFTNRKNGRVYKLMKQLENSTPNQVRSHQRTLFEAIKLPTEQSLPIHKQGGNYYG